MQHLLDAVSGFTAPVVQDCLHQLTCLVNFLLSGKAPRLVAPWLCGAPITALHKKNGGVCPIAVCETIWRLVSRICCLSVHNNLPDLFLPYGQVGVGIKGGLEAAIHSFRHFLHYHKDDPNLCAVKLDMYNAFNEVQRASFLRRFERHFPGMYPWVRWFYQYPSNLRLGPLAFQCSNGVQQGDPLGPLLFSLVLLDFMDSIEVPPDISFQLWYLDDGTFAGTRSAVAELLELFCKHGPSFGLILNLKKCEVFWPSGDSAFQEFPPEICRPLQTANGVELLGGPISGSPEYFDDFATALFDKVKYLQDLLSELEDPQVELQLLRQCLSCCKIVHMLRTVNVPPHMLHNLSLFDNQLRSSLSRVVRTSISDLTWQQATLPLRLGGLGIWQASDMTYAAYLGSCSASKELVCQLLDLNFDSDFRLVGEDMAQHTFISLFTSSFVFSSTSQTILQSTLDDQIYSDIHTVSI